MKQFEKNRIIRNFCQYRIKEIVSTRASRESFEIFDNNFEKIKKKRERHYKRYFRRL